MGAGILVWMHWEREFGYVYTIQIKQPKAMFVLVHSLMTVMKTELGQSRPGWSVSPVRYKVWLEECLFRVSHMRGSQKAPSFRSLALALAHI